jgi:hypothetical protein
MTITPEQIIRLSRNTIKKSFFEYFICRTEVQTKHFILSEFYPKETVIRSAIGGIETSLGSTFWEKISIEIAKNNGFEVLNPKIDFKEPKVIPVEISNLLTEYKNKRESQNANIPLTDFTSALRSVLIKSFPDDINLSFKERLSKGTGVDIYLKKNSVRYAFELKTVQINAGSGPKFNETLMKWLIYDSLSQHKHKTAESFRCHVVIPYDPTSDSSWWSKFGGRAYPLDHNDLLLGEEYWSLISGIPDTLKYIKSAVKQLTDEGFPEIYKDSIHSSNPDSSIGIIQAMCGVKCLTNTKKTSIEFSTICDWICCKCGHKFSKSVKWFKGECSCYNCKTSLFNFS